MNRALLNAQKITFLSEAFPDHKIKELSTLCQFCPLEFNSAVWLSIELGYLTVDESDGTVTGRKAPKEYEFDEEIDYLLEAIPFVFTKLAESEADLEETYFTNWAAAYKSHDITIAMRILMAKKIMASYTITNVNLIKKAKKNRAAEVVEDVYTFYCLPENVGKEWGRKQFQDEGKLIKTEDSVK